MTRSLAPLASPSALSSLSSLSPLSALSALALLAGCAGTTPTLRPSSSSATPAVAHAALAGGRATKVEPQADAKSAARAPAVERHPGDFVVFRFTGTFHKGPLTLTERIVAREGTVLTVDFTLAESISSAKGVTIKETTLRAKVDTKVGGRSGVFDVARVDAQGVTPATVADWEAMMAKTVVVADANEETFGTEAVTIKVGNKELHADRTAYRILLGDKSATMRITQSDGFAWGDLGSEIVGDDGSVIYRAEIVETGAAPGAFVATDDDI